MDLKKLSTSTFAERLADVLNGINLAELKNGNQSEVYKFYAKNISVFKGMAYRFCKKRMGYNYDSVHDLMQEIYLYLPTYDYSTYQKFTLGMWRTMMLYSFPRIKERDYLRLDAPVSKDIDKSLYEIVAIPEMQTANHSNDETLSRLIDWLRRNLTKQEFLYVYYRYIKYETNNAIFTRFGYSLLCDDRNIDRIDFRIMQNLREKYYDLATYVGGIFTKFIGVLPMSLEKRRAYMTSLCLRPNTALAV